MKLPKIKLIACCIFITSFSFAQSNEDIAADSTGLPGDHFSLQGALEMFKKSSSLEDFEKKINSESNYVNNLDLNEDGKTDYITVNDIKENDTHAIILKVAVNEKEWQDVAVIEIQKDANESAILQIVGDEEIYGEKKIIEPVDEKEVPQEKSGGYGPYSPDIILRPLIVNVWGWPCVHFIYAPLYVPWVSPCHWGFYPAWFSPWYVHPWRWHYRHCYGWGMYYHPVYVARITSAGAIYSSRRSVSTTVTRRYATVQTSYRTRSTTINKTTNINRAPAQEKVNQNRSIDEKSMNKSSSQEKQNVQGNNVNKSKNNTSRQERRASRGNNRHPQNAPAKVKGGRGRRRRE